MTSFREARSQARGAVRDAILRAVRPWEERQDHLRVALGRIESRTVRAATYRSIQEAEFRVYSQFGEDGIIQYLLSRIGDVDPTFVEFGVEDYRQANTRFLLEKDGWSGLILDAGIAHYRFAGHPRYRWRYPVATVTAFITRENINELISGNAFNGPIGLLSIDIDGNDYWVWEAIEVVQPAIVVIEYNSIFGADASITVPYDPSFFRGAAHPSRLYFGASLAALCRLADRKGYVCVGCTSAGNNAFFVKGSLAAALRPLTAPEAYVRSRFREGLGKGGVYDFRDPHTVGLRSIAHLPVHDVGTDQEKTVGEALCP